MVVYYSDIMDRIMDGEDHDYTYEMVAKLCEWANNDKRSQAAINRERK